MQTNSETNQTAPTAPTARVPEQAPVISMGEWMVTLLLLAIPAVNIIMMLVWAFGGGANPNKRNLMRAYLVWTLIGIVLYFLFFATLFSAMMSSY